MMHFPSVTLAKAGANAYAHPMFVGEVHTFVPAFAGMTE
jgi:hypothetical protein